MRLAPAGVREWGGGGILAILIVGLAWWLCPQDWMAWLLTLLSATLWICIAWFFRDPSRRLPDHLQPGDLLSPADGRISAIETVEDHDAVDGAAIIIRIFLSVLNVHVNRMPCDIEVLETIYTPGRYLDARKPESAQVNESMLTCAKRSDGLRVGIRQISGAIARRIICPVREGQSFSRGDRYGMIKFGSTTELIIPDDGQVDVCVSVGERVLGGETVLAHVTMSGA